MDWLTSAMVAVLSATFVQVLVYAYLATVEKEKFLKVWMVSWCIYLVNHSFGLARVHLSLGSHDYLLIGKQLAVLWSAYLLFWGTRLFEDRPISRGWMLLTLLTSAYTVVAVLSDMDFVLVTLPAVALTSSAFITTGATFIRSQRLLGPSTSITGIGFIVWGLHKANYPFLRNVAWFAPWGFILAAVLGLLVSIGMVIIYYEDRRRKLHEEKSLIEHLGEAVPVGIMVLNLDLRVTYANRRAAELLRIDAALPGLPISAFPGRLVLNDRAYAWGTSPLARGGDAIYDFHDRLRIIHEDGQERVLDVNSISLKDSRGRPRLHLAAIADATENQLNEDKLGRLNRALRLVSSSNEAVLRARASDDLLSRVIHLLVDGRTYTSGWFGRGTAEHLHILQRHGSIQEAIPNHEMQMARIALRDSRPQVRRRSFDAIREGRPGHVALPFRVDDDYRGVLFLTTAAPGAFDDEELDLLEGVASNVAFGLRALARLEDLDHLVVALQESEGRFRTLFEEASFPIGVSRDGTIVKINRAACDLLGESGPDRALGRPLSDFVIESERSRVLELARRRESRAGRMAEKAYRSTGLRRDGTSFPMLVYGTELDLPEGRSSLVYLEDITDRVNAERAREAYEARLRAMAAELTMTEERERRSLASMLHDGIIQNLAAVKNQLSQLQKQYDSSEEAAQELSQSVDLLAQTIDDTRSLTLQISPPILYHLGLESALDWLADWMLERWDFRVQVQPSPEPPQLPDEIASSLFRAVRELLINARKHSQVSNAVVFFQVTDSCYRITVSDNGRGFDPERLKDRTQRGFGLFAITERLYHLGGSTAIESAPGRGTRVALELPLAELSVHA